MEHKKIEIEKLDLPFEKQTDRVEFIKVDCPSCNEQVTAENIELESKIGKCGNCNAVFSMEKEISGLHKEVITTDKIERPAGVEAFHFRNELEIELEQPFPILDIIILSIAPFILIFALLLYFVRGINPGLLVYSISTALMAKSVFRLIRKKRYKINLTIKERTISVLYTPNSLKKDKEYNISDIDQVYVAQTTDGAGLFFVLNGVDGQRHEQVLGRSKNYIHLKYIEQEIEQYLDIKDRKIAGEI